MFDEAMKKQINHLLDETCGGNVENLLEFSPDALSTLYSLAFHLYQNGKHHDSKQVFRFLTLSDPLERRYWMGLASSYQMLKDYRSALECYSIAAVQDPNDPYVHLHAADCLFATGQIHTAIKTLESAIAVAERINNAALLTQLKYMHSSWTGRKQKITVG